MFRRYCFPVIGSLAFVLSTGMLAFGQNGQLRGHVTLKQPDGTVVPAADAVVDVFRVDLSSEFHLKANNRGEFVHPGLPYGGDYVIGVSLPGAQPAHLPGVKVGRDIDYAIELKPGDGSRLTIDAIKAMGDSAPASSATKESAEDKAKRAELLKKNDEIMASNEKAKNSNAIVERAFKAGNEALKARNYDLAITEYDVGLSAEPDHPGAPSLLTNKTMALNSRAVEKYNTAIKATDDAAKTAGLEAANKDWTEASQLGAKAVALLKAVPASTDAAESNATKRNLYYALVARAEATRLFVVKVDQGKADAGVTALEEYMAAETDPVRKSKAQHDLANMLFDANVFDSAVSEYQKILEGNPDDLNALLRAGQALFNIAAINNGDKAKYQEAANYLAQFVAKAPDTNPFKADAQAILDTLKDQANVEPEAATPVRRTRRP